MFNFIANKYNSYYGAEQFFFILIIGMILPYIIIFVIELFSFITNSKYSFSLKIRFFILDK